MLPLALLLAAPTAPAVAFPPDPWVIDAKRDLGAKGDGVADDTEALQKGLDLSCGVNQRTTKVLFLPAGIYRVTKTLVAKAAVGPWLYGEGRDRVRIKLDDGATGVTSVLRTHPSDGGDTSADWFMRTVRHLTIDAGDNPQTDGVRWYATPEFASLGVRSLFDGPTAPLRLPVKPEPAADWDLDLAKWVCANDHGATSGDNSDDTAAIQKAIDAAAAAGKTTVYFRGCGGPDPNHYTLDGEVRVHGSVRHVLGLGFGRVLGKGRLVVDDRSAPVVTVRHLDAFGGRPITVENRSKANTLVLQSCGVKVLGTGAGDVFATDCPALVELTKPGQKAWCRHLNPEGDSDAGLVENRGADLWVLGLKHEGPGVRVAAAGGRTELFGVFNYGPGLKDGDRRPMFDLTVARVGVYGLREMNFAGHAWKRKVVERRNGVTKELGEEPGHGWIGFVAGAK